MVIRKWLKSSGANALILIAAGFAVLILIGSLLLVLPCATQSGKSIGWFDGLFTSTSAVCVTGLVVRDTGTTFNLFGKIVLLCLIQVGGLGFMTFTMLIIRMLGRESSLTQRMLIRESMNEDSIGGMDHLIRWVLVSSVCIELCGAVLLSIRMIPYCHSVGKGLFYSLFHAVSAFCNAGFDLFGNGSSLTGFSEDVLMNFAAIFLVVFGGMGFQVLRNIKERMLRGSRIHLQTRVVLTTYGILLVFGFVFTLVAEWSNPETLGNLSVGNKLLAALFQSVTLRTAGFNTINEQALRPASKMIDSLLMITGASSASTGGGIKVTTVAVIFLSVRATVSGQDRIVCYKRTIPADLVRRAVAVTMAALTFLMIDTITISLLQPELDFMDILFECSSAVGTVGVSAFGTSNLQTIPRVLLILTMYAGRIGPLSLALILAHRGGKRNAKIDYPESKLMIG